MAKKADDDLIPIKIQRKVEPAFKLPPIAPLPPSLRVSLPLEEIERQRRQVEEARRLEERLPKADPAKAARLAEGRRLLDRFTVHSSARDWPQDLTEQIRPLAKFGQIRPTSQVKLLAVPILCAHHKERG